MPGNKRMLGVAILNVLKEYSDAEHPLKRNDIIALVQKHYIIISIVTGKRLQTIFMACNLWDMKSFPAAIPAAPILQDALLKSLNSVY